MIHLPQKRTERMMDAMKTNEIIRGMMSKNGMRGIDLAEKLGVGTTALANRLNRGVLSTPVLGKMLEIFGYKIVLVPKDTKLKDNWYEVTDSNEDEQ